MAVRRASRTIRKPPLDVEALWAIKRIGVPTISPDGRLVCAPVTTYDMEKNDGTTELWLFPTGLGAEGGIKAKTRRLTAGDKDSDPRWSPDGRFIAFTAKRKDDAEPQVYVIASDGGEAQRVTSLATGASAVKWFPDGRRLAFVSWVWPDLRNDAAQAKRTKERKDAKVKAHITERSEFRYWDHWLTDGREPHVFMCELPGGRTRDLCAGTGFSLPPWDPGVVDFDIAPDGRQIALQVDRASEPGMMHQLDIVTIDVASGRKRVLTEATGLSDANPVYSPDGRYIAFLSYDTNRAFNDQGHVSLYERRTGRITKPARGFDRGVSHVTFTADSRALTFMAEDRGRVGIWRLGLDAAMPAQIVPGGSVSGYAASAAGDVLAYTRSTATHPPALFAARGDGSDERSIESLNRAVMSRHAVGAVREFTVKGFRGEPVQM